MINKEIALIFKDIAKLLNIRGDSAFHINAYLKSADYLEKLTTDISEIYKEKGLEGLKVPRTIGEKNAKKIEEYIKFGKIKEYQKLKEETAIQNIIAYFFESKGIGLQELKNNAKKRKIVYSRFTKPAKQLLDLSGSVEKAKQAIDKVSKWAKSRKLDYAIETVFKKWLELDQLKPKEIVKKPFYKGNPMVFSETKKKWFVISKYGEWLEFADKENTIEWRIVE